MKLLKTGDRGKEVLDVQSRLKSLGFDLGTDGVDGYFGDDTRNAVLLFQQQNGLVADGVVADNTWCELVESGYLAGERLLYLKIPPFRGADVLMLQRSLNCLGFNAGPEDAIFGSMTERAVLDFQKNSGLVMDGMVDPSVLQLIDRVTKDGEPHNEEAKIPDRHGGSAGGKALADCTIVIDPGHGGEDEGIVIDGGAVREKDVTLSIASDLARSLEASGARVVLTREGDQSVPLYIRPASANTARADLFISIHMNANPNPDAEGAAAYYFSRKGYFSEAGKLLAESIADSIAHALEIPAIPAVGSNCAVLRETEMTAVLVEPAFMTSGIGGKRITSESFIESTAEAIFTVLDRYFAPRGIKKR